MWILTWLFNLSPKAKIGLLAAILFLIAAGYVGCLTHQARKAEREAKAAQEEADRLQRQNEGLKILTNTANIAIEVENEKKIANVQARNSNLANGVYANTRRIDSNQSSGNFNEARRKFCLEFPNDSKCN